MKRIIYILFLLPLMLRAQDNSQNFVKSIHYRQVSSGNPQATVQYLDGFGRLVQKVVNKQSGTGKDLVTHYAYDQGRQIKEYLTYSTDQMTMPFYPNAEQSTLNYSHYVGKYPVSEKLFESSPLERVLKQGAPGADWQVNPTANNDHTIKFEYRTNVQNEVKRYFATTTWNATSGLYDIQLTDNGYYAANDLEKSSVKDENWTSGTNNTSEEFKNKEGQLVLKRTYSNGAHDTYYVYDKFGNLTYVIPPLVTNPTAQLNDLCYQYKYDKRKRLAEKKLPGKQWEFMVYNKADKLVATGPANSPFSNLSGTGWLITKYDAFGRVAYSGWYNGTEATATGRKTMQATLNFSGDFYESRNNPFVLNGVTVGYTNYTFPTGGMHVLSINYYDNYSYPSALAVPSAVEGQSVLSNPKTLMTANWLRILTTSNETLAEVNTIFYDAKAREVRGYISNQFGGYTQIDTKLDFTGKKLYTKTFHKRDNTMALLTIVDQYTYTPEDRPLLHTQQINNEPVQLLTKNTYNEIGELISKNVGGTDATGAVGLQKVDYRYNIRGWLTDINNMNAVDDPVLRMEEADLFGFKINYNQVTETDEDGIVFYGTTSAYGNVKRLYNGNISETFWKTKSDNVLRKYGYKYDDLNRLTGAYYQKPLAAETITNSYDEYVSYDKNGNILNLKRMGNLDHPNVTIDIDDLTYVYNGNRLMRVNDLTNNPEGFKDNGYGNTYNDYAYDANGNMTQDANKKITNIVYNHLNLPTEILFADGNKINYIYNAGGNKVQKSVLENGSTKSIDYLSGFQYLNMKLSFFPHVEGYVKVTSDTYFNYVFNYTDHLGNIRVSWTWDDKNGALAIMEENHYYPFGLKHRAYNTEEYTYTMPMDGSPGYNVPELNIVVPRIPNPYKYRYNGKEFQDELGLNVYDYGARNYDAAIGRWMNIDPKSELLERSSPYVYALNSPIVYVDGDGELPILINGKTMADSERADISYWTKEIVNTIKNSGIANPGGEVHYVDGNRGWNHYNGKSWASERNPEFPSDRRMGGRLAAKDDWKNVLSKLARDPKTGKIIEKIQIYTHSRGSAFGVGYTEELLKLIKENAREFLDANNVIDYVFNMAPHQSDFLTSPEGVDGYSMDHSRDKLSDNDMKGLEGAFTSKEKSNGAFGAHSITSFNDNLKVFISAYLKGGTNKDINNNFIKMMKEKYGITVKIK
ncbi:DUF6443 domain-containing protein [Flavobacterium cerinum]|uniref:DUF6443 domain-containing protein n=1 Tax=Flavobacterium cerinum TaxID=2502784 RepID=A0ABY5IQY0_9FLAO|nr:DUF6443 domain-containing protein [Flavobacterium cerinum]UUC45205.1 DUF6443 domain-containing protein [Flavobacterium cerinum]